MNLTVFELFSCLLRAKQIKIKGLKETSKQGANTRKQTEPYEQWIFKGVECSKCQLLHEIFDLFREEIQLNSRNSANILKSYCDIFFHVKTISSV